MSVKLHGPTVDGALTVDTSDIQAGAVTGAKVVEKAIGELEPVAVALDHADASPVTLLVSNASNDRILLVRGVATEAAAGGPDVDIGSESNLVAIVEDFAEGAWAVGDRFEGLVVLPAGEALVATIAAAGTAGAFDIQIISLTPTIRTAQIAADAVTGAKLGEKALGEIEAVAVALDHADGSPAELLAADANLDRLVWVRAVATEAAAGEPDVDVGSATTDPNGVVDDFAAGAWVLGDRFEGFLILPKTEALVATIAAAGTAGAFSLYIVALTPTVQAGQIADGAVTTAKIAADAVTGAKIVEKALGEIEAAAVALDHADGSPAELLAADANSDRLVWVRAVATEAAAGEPDIDVGSATTDPNGIVDDFAAGAWALGDRFEGFIVLPKTEALVATIAAAGTAGAFDVYVTVLTQTVQTAQLANDAVTTAKILDANVTDAKLASKIVKDDGSQAIGWVDLTGAGADAETVTVQGRVYELDTHDAETITGDVRVDVSGGSTVKSQGTLTLNSNPGDAETVTIDGKVYTLELVLTDVDGHVLIGGTASITLDNLIDAINLGAGAGTDYAAATTLHPTVSAAAGAADTMVATAKEGGTAGDAIATTEGLVDVASTWDAGTLGTTTAGVDPTVGECVTALVTAINADVDRVVDAYDGGTNTVLLIARAAGATNYTLAETLGAGVVSGAAMVNAVADDYREVYAMTKTITAADVTVTTDTNGTILVAAIPITAAPTIWVVQCRSSAGVLKALANCEFVWRQFNANFRGLELKENQNGATNLAENDTLSVMVVV